MPLEIERRFLVRDETWRRHVHWVAELRQGYLASREDGFTVRVRLQEQADAPSQAWLTLKARADPALPAHARLELEYPIPLEDGHALMGLAQGRVEKRRYGLQLPGGDWVLDVFLGANEPLVIAEVELRSVEDELLIPPWCAREITGIHSLSNSSLAQRPWQAWQQAERNSLWPPFAS